MVDLIRDADSLLSPRCIALGATIRWRENRDAACLWELESLRLVYRVRIAHSPVPGIATFSCVVSQKGRPESIPVLSTTIGRGADHPDVADALTALSGALVRQGLV